MIISLMLFAYLLSSISAVEQYLDRGQALIKLLQKRTENRIDKYSLEYEKFNPLIRYPVLLERSENWWYFDNFRNGIHQSEQSELSRANWTSVVLDSNKVRSAALLIGRFRNTSLSLGHLFSLFEFEDDSIHLVGGKRLSHLVISFEALRLRGEKYSMWDGAWSRYGASYVLGSFSDVLQKAALFYAGMEIYQLNLSKSQVQRFLVASLEDSLNTRGLKVERYNTIKNSCVTRQFDLLNSILPQANRLKTWWTVLDESFMRTWASFWPGHTKQSLINMGIFKSQELLSNRETIENRLNSLSANKR